MRTVSGPLAAHFAAGRNGWSADLFTITLSSGAVLRWTGADVAVPWGGNTYLAGPGIERGKVRWSLGLEVGELPLTLYPRSTDVIGATPLAVALRRGDFDGAGVQLDRAFAARGGEAIIGVIDAYFLGRMGPIEGDGLEFRCTVRDPREALDKQFPKNIVQPQCANRLFDAVCGLNPASNRSTGTVTAASGDRTQITSTLTAADNVFTLGRFRWMTGANAGRSGPVRLYANASGGIKFSAAWPEAIVAGDTFEVWAGCDKRQTTCIGKFNNVVHFRGMPFVPAAETTT